MSNLTSPRRFSSPPTAQELERLAEDVARISDQLQFAVSLKPRLGIYRQNVTLGRNEIVRIDTDSGISVRAMLPDVRKSGVCGLIRMSGLGAIDVVPAPGVTVDGVSTYSVSADVFCQLFYSDSVNWYSVV